MNAIPFYAKRFVSGVNFTEALPTVKKLNDNKISVTLDILGESITSREQALFFTKEYEDLLIKINENKLDSTVSLKLTMLGLDIDTEFCYTNLIRILSIADSFQSRVAFDMEGTQHTERTVAMYERVAKEFKSPEIVLQAYLYRTDKDCLRALAANGRMRLCKGAYKENPEHALQKMPLIVENYNKLIANLLLGGKRVCIASHDDKIINFCLQFIEENSIPKERYEFQMLYGMREKTWYKIKEKGHNVTIYVPFGNQWQAYYARRLTERKENIFFLLRNFFKS